MTESDRLEETQRWLRYAHEDLLAAEAMLEWEGQTYSWGRRLGLPSGCQAYPG